jgi:hypothetical protein
MSSAWNYPILSGNTLPALFNYSVERGLKKNSRNFLFSWRNSSGKFFYRKKSAATTGYNQPFNYRVPMIIA